jgi:hypothetical protein
MGDELANAIERAVKAVDAAAVPEDLREIAFTKALESTLGIAAGAPTVTPSSGGGSGAGTGTITSEGPRRPTDRVGTIAAKCGVGADRVAKVLEEDGDELHIIVPRSRFDSAKKRAMQQVALLIAAGRQAAGIDEDATSLVVIKERCDEVGVLDDGNFSRHMAEKRDGVRIKGGDRKRELKVNGAGFEAAGKLISTLAEEPPANS